MAEVTRRCCDLCGCEAKGKQQMGVLAVPKAKRAKAKPVQDSPISIVLFGGDIEEKADRYDVCLTCCEGLLKLAAAHKDALRQRLEAEMA